MSVLFDNFMSKNHWYIWEIIALQEYLLLRTEPDMRVRNSMFWRTFIPFSPGTAEIWKQVEDQQFGTGQTIHECSSIQL